MFLDDINAILMFVRLIETLDHLLRIDFIVKVGLRNCSLLTIVKILMEARCGTGRRQVSWVLGEFGKSSLVS